jgi:hypothetical protein
MFVRFYGACALAVALLTSCGGEKAENKTDKKEEPKTEATDKKPEPEQKPEAPAEKDLASQLIGEWEIVKSFDPSGAEDGTKGTLTFTKTDFTRTIKAPSASPSIKGTWTLDPTKKDPEAKDAVNCIVFKNAEMGEMFEFVLPIENDMLTLLVTTPMPSKVIYKRK